MPLEEREKMPIAVHGHFYQPPREDPATGRVPDQPGAAPFHDWNERVNAECYRPNAFVRVPDEKQQSGERVVNNFERMSFNVGPTLLAWMAEADPETYSRIVDADRISLERLGHGNAIAQSFHHTILPLSPPRDVRTQVRWGLADFRHRFGREPEGMWLPETAANEPVLEILIEEGVTFTILSPTQAAMWKDVDGRWHAPPLDTRYPYLWKHRDGSGRSLTVFFYDSEIARMIAFEAAAANAQSFLQLFAERLEAEDQLVNSATDGETYGHHHKFSDLGLAFALFVEAERRGIAATNYAAYLAAHQPEREVRIIGGEGSAWSCAHGVGRWMRDCGCSTGGEPGWTQAWRGPLREALDLIRVTADEAFDRLGGELFIDPWRARDRYVDVVVGAADIDDFLRWEAARPLRPDDVAAATRLLAMQEWAMAMYTSCGWFFNDIGGIETVQVLRYAKAVMDALEELGQPRPDRGVATILERARSNDPAIGSGADVYAGLATGSFVGTDSTTW